MASRLRIVGGTPLRGQITVRGAKNLVPKAMVAALLAPRTSTLRNVPLIRDVDVVSDLLRMHGVTVDYDQEAGVLDITPGRIHLPSDPVEMDRLAGSSRIPILFAGPLLAPCPTPSARPSPPTWAAAISATGPWTSTSGSSRTSAPCGFRAGEACTSWPRRG